MQTQAVIEHIVRWLHDYAGQARVKGFIVGISGGIDSAVVSALAARTGLDVLLLEMPIRQQAEQIDRAQQHIADLQSRFANVRSLRVDLNPAFNCFADTVEVSEAEYPAKQLALANSRARLRMLTLYYYGPIADLTKTQVYRLAESLNIIEAIRKAVPTDGLWDTERTDEQQMGASYPELEWAMDIPADKQPEDFEGRQREVLAIYRRLNRAAQHKIQPIPVCNVPKEWLA